MAYVVNVIRSLTHTDSLFTGVVKAFVGFAIVLTLILCGISVASLAQTTMKLFPRLMEVHVLEDRIIFDHRISNVTLIRKQHQNNVHNTHNECTLPSLMEPYYSLCDWKDHGASAFDFALAAELAYLDVDSREEYQYVVDSLFPNYDFSVLSYPTPDIIGPMSLVLDSRSLNLTIVAVRGTDIGRLHDFLEDVKLYAEPVIFTLLSAVFPTIRLWSHDTTSSVIAWLYEFNSFFGLQGEAEYYHPLIDRVANITSTLDRHIVITGHSLGGGLARIVGTLTEVGSVSFSPPGLGLSYRKYSAVNYANDRIRKSSLHHKSIAVVTEFDWIAGVDYQVGLVQRIMCDREDKAHQNACHLLEGTICHLLQHCGDPNNRFDTCEYDFDVTALVPMIVKFAWTNKWIVTPFVVVSLTLVILAIIPEIL